MNENAGREYFILLGCTQLYMQQNMTSNKCGAATSSTGACCNYRVKLREPQLKQQKEMSETSCDVCRIAPGTINAARTMWGKQGKIDLASETIHSMDRTNQFSKAATNRDFQLSVAGRCTINQHLVFVVVY